MSWGEAVRLIGLIRADPSSQLAAAVEEWDYPLDRASWMMADLIDVEIAKSGAKNRKPYPRPMKKSAEKRQRGNAAGRTPDEIKTILREQFGHEPPV